MAERATFGKYVLLRKLATGGMGEVFLAKQVGPSGFEKLLVIKRILAQHHDKNEYVTMFLSEARLVAHLTHSNIIQIHEMGQIDGDFFIAMEYVRGKSLRDIIDALRAQGRLLPLPHVIDLAIKLCDGLANAHDARDIRGRPMNIIHRDINPHNILISYGGDLKLIDFGIAKSEMASVHTATGTIKGKFVYMSPEQSAADPIDRRSDIFSLGIVLYEMTTGENPFVRQNVVLSLEAIQRHAVTLPSTKRNDAGPLDSILEKALEKKPENRFQNAFEMRDELRALLRSGDISPAEQDLSSFLHDLFHADIGEEDRLLAEADRATSPPPPAGSPRVPSRPAPSQLPANLPAMPNFAESPAASLEALPAKVDQDTRADRPVTRRTPQPLSAKPFSDEEPTVAGDLENLAERSRLHGSMSKGGPAGEPSGQILTLIPPEDVAPGTNEAYGDLVRPEHDTRRDRLPIPPPADSSRISASPPAITRETAPSVPSSAPPIPMPSLPPPPPSQQMAIGAFMEPLEGRLSTRPPPPPPSTGLSGRPYLIAPASSPPVPVPVNGSARGVFDHSDPDPAPEPSESLPIYTGLSRRSAVIGGAFVFVLAALAGFWGVRALMGTWPEAEEPVAPITAMPPAAEERHVPVEPAADPSTTPVPAPEPPPAPEAVAPPKPAVSPEVPLGAKPAPEPAASEKRPRASAKKEPTAEPKRDTRPAEPKREAAPPPDVVAKAPEPKKREVVRPDEPAKQPAPEVRPPAKAEEAQAPKKARLGIITLSASEELTVEHEGRPLGSAPSTVMVRADAGTLSLASSNIPYVVRLTYRAVDGELQVKVDSTPWAIAKHNGISLGKTPQGPVTGKRHQFTLMRPGQASPLVVSLIWNPSSP